MKVGIAIGVVIAVLALVVCLVPLKEVAYTVTVDYEDTETCYWGCPESYEVTETYTEDVHVEMEILEHSLVSDSLLFVRGKVKNTGDRTLASTNVTIWVKYEVEGLEGTTFLQPGGISLSPATFKPDEVRDFSVLVQDGTTNYEIIPPATTKTVEGERTITMYRYIEKERTVIKQRQETRYKKVTLLDYFLHY